MSDLTPTEKFLKSIGITRIRRGDWLRYLVFPSDFSADDIRFHRQVERYTMTRPERILSLRTAIQYLVQQNIRGAFVECGVWKGGSIMAMAYTLNEMGARRDIFLFDTFEGMTRPSDYDITTSGARAVDKFKALKTGPDSSQWDYASIDDVRRNVFSTGYPDELFHFVQGKVEDTLPLAAPDDIALLRLDTDFYESTKHELIHLYPRVARGGVIILDDYGHWKGARKAVDEYLSDNSVAAWLMRIDFASRAFVKP